MSKTKEYTYFISYSGINLTTRNNFEGNLYNFRFSKKITAKNINESMEIIRNFLFKEKNVNNAIIHNFILLLED